MTFDKNAKKISLQTLLPLLLFFSILSFATIVNGTSSESDFIGTWVGVITTAEGKKNPVDLRVVKVEDSSSSITYRFHYGPTRSCELVAVKVSLEKAVLSLVFDDTSGGFCDKLWQKEMKLKLLDEQSVGVSIQMPDSSLEETTLHKENNSSPSTTGT